jgi:hypothetical protein
MKLLVVKRRKGVSESVKIIPYRDRESACITVTHLSEPYGPGTEPVISIGCTLKDTPSDPTWKVHVPLYLIPELIDTLWAVSLDSSEEKE